MSDLFKSEDLDLRYPESPTKVEDSPDPSSLDSARPSPTPTPSTSTTSTDPNAAPMQNAAASSSRLPTNGIIQIRGRGIISTQSARPTATASRKVVGAKKEKRPKDFFGPIKGVEIGAHWLKRKDCSQALVHRPHEAGIAWSHEGAYSIVVSGTGSYSHDHDQGNILTYTGTGGFERKSVKQVSPQSFDHKMNASLQTSQTTGKPVRVVRSSNLNSKYAPGEGYRYDGLYRVVDSWYDDESPTGFRVCKFRLERLPGQPDIPVRQH